jgi:tripartite-type tricarboxylate transporter receptor subunit TctC
MRAFAIRPASDASLPDGERRRWLGLLIGALMADAARSQSQTAGFPERPITLYCPWTAGGPTDIALRALAEALVRTLQGKRVLIENKPGAGGALGAQMMAASAKPDGYTPSIP